MNEFLIIGSGFSALVSYLRLKKFNPLVISTNINTFNDNFLKRRKNLDTNKFFSKKSKSFGNFEYQIPHNIKFHDRNSFGGNTNIWGGFINIENLTNKFIELFDQNGINLTKLDMKANGYKSNNINIRQLRQKNNQILESKNFIENINNGFVNVLKFEEKYIEVEYYSLNDNKFLRSKFKKVFLALSFSQLIDLLFRSEMITKNIDLNLTEFDHKFVKTISKNFSKYSSNENCVIKYDFLRALKHYYGFKKDIDRFRFNISLYIDQIFSKKIRNIDLSLNIKDMMIRYSNTKINFGDSIHYCNLRFDGVNIKDYIKQYSSNLIGISTPFVSQKFPGPISNDIISNFNEESI